MMRIDQIRILEVMRAYEKSRTGGSRRQERDPDAHPAVRDEVIISTEAKRRQILDRVSSQVVERLRHLPPSESALPNAEAVLEEATRDILPMPRDAEQKARRKEPSSTDRRSARTSR